MPSPFLSCSCFLRGSLHRLTYFLFISHSSDLLPCKLWKSSLLLCCEMEAEPHTVSAPWNDTHSILKGQQWSRSVTTPQGPQVKRTTGLRHLPWRPATISHRPSLPRTTLGVDCMPRRCFRAWKGKGSKPPTSQKVWHLILPQCTNVYPPAGTLKAKLKLC